MLAGSDYLHEQSHLLVRQCATKVVQHLIVGTQLLQHACYRQLHSLVDAFLSATLVERLELPGEVVEVEGNGLLLHELDAFDANLEVLFDHFFALATPLPIWNKPLCLHPVDATLLVWLVLLHHDYHFETDHGVAVAAIGVLCEKVHHLIVLNRLEAQFAH